MNEFMDKIKLEQWAVYFIAGCFSIITVCAGTVWSLSYLFAYFCTKDAEISPIVVRDWKKVSFAAFYFVNRKILKK